MLTNVARGVLEVTSHLWPTGIILHMARNEPITETEANQPAPDRLQKGGSGMASAVEAQSLGQPVPSGTGTSTRDLPSWPRAPRRIGSAAARRSLATAKRATLFVGSLAVLFMVSAGIAAAHWVTVPSLIPAGSLW